MKRDSWKFLGGDMGKGALMKYMLLFLALALLLFTGWEGYFYIKDNFTSSAARQVMKQQGVNSGTHVSDNEDRVVSRVHYKRPDFEAGITFPEWTPDGYGAKWQQQLPAIQTQPGARWMEMTVFLSQATDNSTQVRTNHSTPPPHSLPSAFKTAPHHASPLFPFPFIDFHI